MVNFSFSRSVSGLENIFAAYRLSTLGTFDVCVNSPVVTFRGAGSGPWRLTLLIVTNLRSDRLTKNRHRKPITVTLTTTPIVTFWLGAMPFLYFIIRPTPKFKVHSKVVIRQAPPFACVLALQACIAMAVRQQNFGGSYVETSLLGRQIGAPVR